MDKLLDERKILDNGYIKLWGVNGDELRIVNAARASFDQRSESLSDKDIRLLNFLAREEHDSPFRQCSVTLEINMPIMVARQLMKYRIGSEFNERSGRYVSEGNEYYIPDEASWRSQPENKKQGSGTPIDSTDGAQWSRILETHVQRGQELYEEAINNYNIAPEQARLFLASAGLYTKVYWTASLQTIVHMIRQREAKDSQYEIQLYAKALKEMVQPYFPNVLPMLINR